jgi:hypothetical protein
MTRIRQWVLTGVLALLLSLSFASLASADPKDTGFEKGRFSATSADPKDGGFQP